MIQGYLFNTIHFVEYIYIIYKYIPQNIKVITKIKIKSTAKIKINFLEKNQFGNNKRKYLLYKYLRCYEWVWRVAEEFITGWEIKCPQMQNKKP